MKLIKIIKAKKYDENKIITIEVPWVPEDEQGELEEKQELEKFGISYRILHHKGFPYDNIFLKAPIKTLRKFLSRNNQYELEDFKEYLPELLSDSELEDL